MMNVNDPRFDETYGPPAAEPKRRSKWAPCLIGCLGVLVVVMLLAIVGGILIVRNWARLAAATAEQMLNQAVEAADLPNQERQEVKAEIKRVTDAIRDEQISWEQFMAIVQGVQRSPLMTLIVVTGVEKQYFDKSGLSDEEKEEGRRALQRFVRGAADGKIEQKSIDSVLTHIGDRQPDGRWEMRQQVSDEDLRAALAEAKKQADEAGIPEEPESFDPSDELKRIIDEAMGELPVKAEAEPAED